MKGTTLLLAVTCLRLLTQAPFAAENILINPGFEEGTLDDAPPWGVGGWRGSLRATTKEAHSGRRSLLQEGGGDEGGINSNLQVVPIDPTGMTKYTLRAWVKIPSGAGRGRMRWVFNDGSGAGFITDIASSDWIQIDQGANDVIPPAGTTHMAFRIYTLGGHDAAYIDDCEMIPEPSGQASYPGVKGTVRDNNGNPVFGAVVFLKTSPRAQEFANSAAVTDNAGNFTVCAADEGVYSVVAWKVGYGLSQEQQLNLAAGNLVTFDPVLTKGSGGRNLALSTAQRRTVAVATDVGRIDDPQFESAYVFDGNNFTTRYYNNANTEPAKDRWIYVDLDPAGKGTFSINEFVLNWLGLTSMTQGWPGLADVAAKDFALEFTTGDPATETNWASQIAFSVADAPVTLAPVVIRLAVPITARAVRLHVTNPAGGGFGPVECEVHSDNLSRGLVRGVVKDSVTGAPITGARVVVFRPVKIQNDPDIYGVGNPVPFVVAEEPKAGTPYEIPVSKNIEMGTFTDANGNFSLDLNPGVPVKVAVSAPAYAFNLADLTPAEDGSTATLDFNLGKQYVLSGVVKDANGPVYNALVQIGGQASKYVAITGPDGAYDIAIGAGTHELYADAYGHSGKIETITVSANTTKDIILETQAEPGSLNADFQTIDDWEIGQFGTDWQPLGTVAAVRSTDQNSSPGGTASALVTDATVLDTTGAERTNNVYEMLQLKSSKRIAVAAGKTYNIYFKAKAENWVTPEHQDTCHFQVLWLDQSGAVLRRIYSHPHWINPQPFWQQYSRGHPEGGDSSIALVRLPPPAGAAWLDVKIGWIRNPSGATAENPQGTNPEGSQLFVDDLTVDSFAGGAAPTISLARSGTQITLTWTGVLESANDVKGQWTPLQGATSPLPVSPTQARTFYRSSSP